MINRTTTIPGIRSGFHPFKIVFIILLLSGLAAFPFVSGNRFYISLITEMMIYGLLAMSLEGLHRLLGLPRWRDGQCRPGDRILGHIGARKAHVARQRVRHRCLHDGRCHSRLPHLRRTDGQRDPAASHQPDERPGAQLGVAPHHAVAHGRCL